MENQPTNREIIRATAEQVEALVDKKFYTPESMTDEEYLEAHRQRRAETLAKLVEP